MARSRMSRAVLVGATLLFLAACAAGPNPAAQVGTAHAAGFWLGLWQGLISPVTFIVSLFNSNVNIYEVHNNGNWYNFGFMLGISAAFGSAARSGAAAGSRRPARQTPRATNDDPPDLNDH